MGRVPGQQDPACPVRGRLPRGVDPAGAGRHRGDRDSGAAHPPDAVLQFLDGERLDLPRRAVELHCGHPAHPRARARTRRARVVKSWPRLLLVHHVDHCHPTGDGRVGAGRVEAREPAALLPAPSQPTRYRAPSSRTPPVVRTSTVTAWSSCRIPTTSCSRRTSTRARWRAGAGSPPGRAARSGPVAGPDRCAGSGRAQRRKP